MRIISGKFKGKPILFVKKNTTRPLKDSVKESIFNVITHSNLININLQKSKILDLYSGTGSFGLEGISRGSKKITFVEKDVILVETLNKNLIALSAKEKATIFLGEVTSFLKKNQNEKFDILFLDPPFISENLIEDLKLIRKSKIFNKNHVLIIHRERKTNDNINEIINTIIVKTYGRSRIVFAKFLD